MSGCKLCNGKLVINKIDVEGRDYIINCPKCKVELSNELRIRLKESGIPKNYWTYSFETYQGDDKANSLKMLKKYVDNFITNIDYRNISLYLYGKVACQKTTMMCVIGKELLKKDINVQFVLAGDLIDLLLKISGFTSDDKNDFIQKLNVYKECDLLLIDDIFDTAKNTYWKNSSDLIKTEWDRFLRYRTSNNRRIIVTSNFEMTEIEKNFGDSVQSLIQRNFKQLNFFDIIQAVAIRNIDKIFED